MYTNVSVHARALVFAFARFRYCENNYVHGYVDLHTCMRVATTANKRRSIYDFVLSFLLFWCNLWTRVDVLTIVRLV